MAESIKPDPNAPTAPPPKADERASKTTTAQKTVAAGRPGGATSLIGTILSGRYRIEKLLGEGGMGAVYQAEHTHMRKRMAIKVLHPEMSRHEEVVRRFEREAKAAGNIEHPNVATATDFGELEDGSFFLALEFVDGESLRERVSVGPIPLGETLHITRQIASALSRAHALGIVHRDLKPENVMLVERDGDPNFVKVLDFGIAKVPSGNLNDIDSDEPGQPVLTRAGMVYGTPEYMAPEQALGQPVDNRADIYALGVMMYEMLTGKRPFDNESKVKLLGLQVTAPVPPMKSMAPDVVVPEEIERVVLATMTKDASDRTPDAKALIEAMTQAVAALLASGKIETGVVAAFTSPAGPIVTPLGMPAITVPPTRSVPDTKENQKATTPSGRAARLAASGLDGRKLVGFIALGTVAVAGLVGLVAYTFKDHHVSPKDAREGGVPLIADTAEVPQVLTADERVDMAQKLLVSGDYGRAVEMLKDVEGTTKPAELHQLRMQAFTKLERWSDAMRDVQELLAIKPDEADEVPLRTSVRDAAISADKEGSELAFSLLEKSMGQAGLVDLFELAYGAAADAYPQAASRAQQVLVKPELKPRMPATLAVNMDIVRAGRSCALKKTLDRAVSEGDKRTLGLLRAVRLEPKPTGNKKDPFACLREDLPKAIAKLQDKSK